MQVGHEDQPYCRDLAQPMCSGLWVHACAVFGACTTRRGGVCQMPFRVSRRPCRCARGVLGAGTAGA